MSAILDTTGRLYDAALALVYPQACDVCGSAVESRHDGVACRLCWAETRLISSRDLLCWKCGVPVPVASKAINPEQVRCHRCDDVSFTAARAVGIYEGALRSSIIVLKQRPQVPERLVIEMVEQCERAPLDRATLILPVPLHPDREAERGFNQAALLGEKLAGRLRLSYSDGVLKRAAHTARHRAGMDAQARRQSVERAFVVSNPKVVGGERILLIDDVYTTGATVSACADALLEAGALEVFVLTLARPRHP
ncbi:MAG TPA: ComF family protein [Pyrinomonadaceae bacterium]|nr:ComF family protein [Pyrinomonadaceae bacterium]